jgi:hypothetical protein
MPPSPPAPGPGGGPRRPMPPLHASEATCLQRCPREWLHAYIDRRVPLVRPEALTRGTSVHRWLNAWWSMSPEFMAAQGHNILPYDPIARACCLGYAARWERPHLLDCLVEEPFLTNVGGVECAGNVDVLGWERRVGDIFDGLTICEHKTTSSDISPGSLYWRQVSQTNLQVSMYAAAFPGAKVLYDVIRKPSFRKLRAGKLNEETDDELVARCLAAMSAEPDKYFARAYVVRLEHEHAAFAQDVQSLDALRLIYGATGISSWRAAHSVHAPRNPASCHSFGRQCGYFEVCWGMERLDNDAAFGPNLHGLEASDEAGTVDE